MKSGDVLKRRKALVLLGGLVFGILFTLIYGVRPRGLIIEITGKPGREVMGLVVADGRFEPVRGHLPARLEYHGRYIQYFLALVNGDPDEAITVQTYLDNGKVSRLCAAPGVVGSYHGTGGGQRWQGRNSATKDINGTSINEVLRLIKDKKEGR